MDSINLGSRLTEIKKPVTSSHTSLRKARSCEGKARRAANYHCSSIGDWCHDLHLASLTETGAKRLSKPLSLNDILKMYSKYFNISQNHDPHLQSKLCA